MGGEDAREAGATAPALAEWHYGGLRFHRTAPAYNCPGELAHLAYEALHQHYDLHAASAGICVGSRSRHLRLDPFRHDAIHRHPLPRAGPRGTPGPPYREHDP